MPTAKHYSLNNKQIYTLKLIYKFRFINSTLLADYRGISRISSNKSLKVLLDKGYIGTRYEKSYKLQGKGPRYYLTTMGIRVLKAKTDLRLSRLTIANLYRNNLVTDVFIEHSLDVMTVVMALKAKYPETFNIYTRTELGNYEYFPKPKPDLYLNRIKLSTKLPNEYMLDIFTDVPPYVIRYRIKEYLQHYDSGDWEADAETDYPALLIVCPDEKSEKQLLKYLARKLDNEGIYIDDLNFYITSIDILTNPDRDKDIWKSVYEPKKVLSISISSNHSR